MLQDHIWLLLSRKMANEATAEELQELEELLRANPELRFTMQTVASLSKPDPVDNYLQIEQAYNQHLNRMSSAGLPIPGTDEQENDEILPRITETNKRRSSRRSLIIGVSVAAAASIIFFFVRQDAGKQNNSNPSHSEISTHNGSRSQVVLPDGTKVWINAGSTVRYDKSFGEAQREVTLTGEAYFNVTHNEEKPFIIHTRGMDIKVLGTEFNVRSYPDEAATETSLIRGSIEVTLKNRSADRIVLKPNEKLVVRDDDGGDSVKAGKKHKKASEIISLSHLNYYSLDSTVLETSWVQNRLVFEDESFSGIARKMERWYGVEFRFADPGVEELRFTGNFQDESVNEALEAMKITAQFNYTINDNTITITR